MKLYFFDVQSWEKLYLETKLKDLKPILIGEPLTINNVSKYQDAQIISIFFGSRVTADILDKLPQIQYINTRSTGFDHIDIQATEKRKIIVTNIPSYGENTVAEYTFGLILNLSRKIIQAYENTKKFVFSCEGLLGFDLQNKILGVVGVGNIGRNVIRIARGFNMNIIAFDIHKDIALSKKLEFTYSDSLQELLGKSDIISLHVPYNKFTHHMINKETVKLIKPGALLINTARGAIVETEALIWALDNKILHGAGLDVLEGESAIKEERSILTRSCGIDELKLIIANHLLVQRDNVIVTPHNAYNSQEAIYRILEITEQNIRSFLNQKPINIIQSHRRS